MKVRGLPPGFGVDPAFWSARAAKPRCFTLIHIGERTAMLSPPGAESLEVLAALRRMSDSLLAGARSQPHQPR